MNEQATNENATERNSFLSVEHASDITDDDDEEENTSALHEHESLTVKDTEDFDNDGVPYDKGWAWMVVFGNFLNYVLISGYVKCGGVFFAELLRQFQAPASQTALLFAIRGGMASLSGLFILNTLVSHLGCRRTVIIGAVLMSLSSMLSSLANELILLICLHAVLLGIADPMLCPPGEVLVAAYFKKRRSLAFSFVKAGASIGVMVYPPLLAHLLQEYGLRGALLLTGAISLHSIPAALLLRPVSYFRSHAKKHRQSISKNRFHANLAKNRSNEETDLAKSSFHAEADLAKCSFHANAEFAKNCVDHTETEIFLKSESQVFPANKEEASGVDFSMSYEFTVEVLQESVEVLQESQNNVMSTADGECDSNDVKTSDSNNVKTSNSSNVTTSDSNNVNTSNSSYVKTSDSNVSTLDSNNDKTSDLSDKKSCPHDTKTKRTGCTTSSAHNMETNNDRDEIALRNIETISSSTTAAMSKDAPPPTGESLSKSIGKFSKPHNTYNADDNTHNADDNTNTADNNIDNATCKFSTLDNTDNADDTDNDTSKSLASKNHPQPRKSGFSKILDFSLFRRPSFCLIFLYFMAANGVVTGLDYLPALAQHNGLTEQQAAQLLSIIGGLDLFSRLFSGFLANLKVVPVPWMVTSVLLVLGLTYQCVPFFTNFNLLLVLAIVQGLLAGVVNCMHNVLIVHVVGVEHLAKGIGFQYLAEGSFSAAFHPFLGYIRDSTGSYSAVYHIIGCNLLLAAALLLTAEVVRKREQKRQLRATQ